MARNNTHVYWSLWKEHQICLYMKYNLGLSLNELDENPLIPLWCWHWNINAVFWPSVRKTNLYFEESVRARTSSHIKKTWTKIVFTNVLLIHWMHVQLKMYLWQKTPYQICLSDHFLIISQNATVTLTIFWKAYMKNPKLCLRVSNLRTALKCNVSIQVSWLSD